MGIYGLDDANQQGDDILCDDCVIETRSIVAVSAPTRSFCCRACRLGQTLEHEMTNCDQCGDAAPKCTLIEKLEGQRLCPRCAHGYELALFTPEDHSSPTCPLCKPRKP